MLKKETVVDRLYLISGLTDEQVRLQESQFTYKENSYSKWETPIAEAISFFVNSKYLSLKKITNTTLSFLIKLL